MREEMYVLRSELGSTSQSVGRTIEGLHLLHNKVDKLSNAMEALAAARAESLQLEAAANVLQKEQVLGPRFLKLAQVLDIFKQ